MHLFVWAKQVGALVGEMLEHAGVWLQQIVGARPWDDKSVRSSSQSRPYPSDMTDEEWKLVRPLVETGQKGPGPRRQVNVRVVLNGIFYKLRNGCSWRSLP